MRYCEKHEVYDRCDERPERKPPRQTSAPRGFRRPDDLRAVEAQFESDCTACDGRIEAGEMILPDEERVQMPGGGWGTVNHGWKHRECP